MQYHSTSPSCSATSTHTRALTCGPACKRAQMALLHCFQHHPAPSKQGHLLKKEPPSSAWTLPPAVTAPSPSPPCVVAIAAPPRGFGCVCRDAIRAAMPTRERFPALGRAQGFHGAHTAGLLLHRMPTSSAIC